MLRDVLHTVSANVREVPTRLAALKGQAGDLSKAAESWVRARAWEVRETTEDNLWALNLEALASATKLTERAVTVPGLERVEPGVRDLIEAWEKITVQPPVAGYAEANVREIIGGLHALDRFGLLRVRHWETAHKARKTVLDAVERELERRGRWAVAT